MATAGVSQLSMDSAKTKIGTDYQEFRGAARWWSGVYHGFQFGGAILSAVAAIALKIESVGSLQIRNDLGAALAAASALLITLLTTGRFKDKWEANRIAAFAVRDLSYEIEKQGADPNQILTKLQRISMTRNNAIVGLPPTTLSGKATENGEELPGGKQAERHQSGITAKEAPRDPEKKGADKP